jgi:hypothetical protein
MLRSLRVRTSALNFTCFWSTSTARCQPTATFGQHQQLVTSPLISSGKFDQRAMATSAAEFVPSSFPPFPSEVPSVSLETFSLADIEKGNQDVQNRLCKTCKSRGFFYLDLNGSEASSMRQDSEDLARLAEEIFRLPLKEKENYPMKNSIFGYCLQTYRHFIPTEPALTVFQVQEDGPNQDRCSRDP